MLNRSISLILSHFNLLYRLIFHVPSYFNLLPCTGGRHLLVLCLLLLVGGWVRLGSRALRSVFTDAVINQRPSQDSSHVEHYCSSYNCNPHSSTSCESLHTTINEVGVSLTVIQHTWWMLDKHTMMQCINKHIVLQHAVLYKKHWTQ